MTSPPHSQPSNARELLPCPFCGASDAFAERDDLSSAYVMCNHCSARGPTECQDGDDEEVPGKAAAELSWNTRIDRADAKRSGVQSDYVMVPKSALAWLFGEGPDLDGKHFDECEDDATPPAGIFPRRYWWRSKFRALIASSVSSAPQDGVQTDAVAWRWRHVNDEKHEWRYQSEPIKNHTEYLEVEPLYASPLSSAESAIGFEEALYDFIKRYPQTLSYLAGRPYCKMSPCQLIEPSWGPCSQCADGATAVTSADRATGPICPYCFGLGKVETSALPSTTLGREGEQ